ncbi:MAG TPA: hypothetical protein VF648_21395 [Pyrinomonadaceae bacterium]|jgi:hypothetical protein
MSGKTLTSQPASGLWNRAKEPAKRGYIPAHISAEPVENDGYKNQAAITHLNARVGISDAAKQRAESYIAEANARAFKPRRLTAESDLQADARKQAAAYIEKLKAKKK